MLSADISDVLKSILLHVASLSRLFSCPFKLERRPDQIMSVYFYAKANAAYDIAPFVFKGHDFGDGWFDTDSAAGGLKCFLGEPQVEEKGSHLHSQEKRRIERWFG